MSNNGTDTVRFIKNPHGNVVSTSNNDKMIILQKQVIVTLLKLDDINQKWKKKEEYKMKKIIASVLSVTLLISAMMGVASAQEVESYNVNVTTTANNAEVENPGVFEGIELPMSCEEAVQEASRCLRCDRHGCGTLRGGREFEW